MATLEKKDQLIDTLIKKLGKETLLHLLKEMLKIRNVETRAEAAYLQGKIGGFFHSYIGQEAIQTTAVAILGHDHWYATTYRCHALALLLGVDPKSLMAELYGKATGNAKGRGGSMHLYTDRMLGGFGIVGGQIPIATGAAFRTKYLGITNELTLCFLGDGAMAQGSFHESLNLAALWSLPCVYIIENNEWGMGTSVHNAVANADNFSKKIAAAYGMGWYLIDGMDFFQCYSIFEKAFHEALETQRPLLIECRTWRFKGHSISDPGLYRTKETLKTCMSRDPILMFKQELIQRKLLTEEEFQAFDGEQREVAIAAMKFADESPWPDPITLEEDVYAM